VSAPKAKRVAVLQSNYIPWKGYFDIIHDVDLFIFYDDVQYTKNDWRNRNRIKTPTGAAWLTIPVGDALDRLVCEVMLTDDQWPKKHWKTISQCYSRAPYFKAYKAFVEDAYLGTQWDSLSSLNQHFTKAISGELLGVATLFRDSRVYNASGKKLDRLMDVIQKTGADTYVSGPSAKDYIDPKRFEDMGIQLVYKSYEGYPEYPQLYPPFEHRVTALDLLFNVGPDASYYIWGWREAAATNERMGNS